MNDLIINKETLVDIADAIREKTGSLAKIQVGQLADEIEKIQIGGGALPNLSNPASIDEVLSGKEFINQNGSKKTGTMPNNGAISSSMDGINTKSITIPEGYTSGGTVSLDNTIDEEVDDQANLIAQITAALEGKAGGGGDNNAVPVLQDKTVTPTTSQQTVTADSGYDGLDTVTVNAIPSTYVKPSSTKSATTYTPTTTAQTIAAGTYCSGAQTIVGDANLVPANIVSGKSIFGVAGTASSSGGTTKNTISVTISIGKGCYAYYYNENFEQQTITSSKVKPESITVECFNGLIFTEDTGMLFGYTGNYIRLKTKGHSSTSDNSNALIFFEDGGTCGFLDMEIL